MWTKEVKTQQQQNKKANIQILARAGIRTRDLSHLSDALPQHHRDI